MGKNKQRTDLTKHDKLTQDFLFNHLHAREGSQNTY